MQAWFTLLMISGGLFGIATGALAHPKFYAAVFNKKRADSADHEHSLD